MSEDDHKFELPPAHLDLADTPIPLRQGTVTALREYMVAAEPNLKFDIDRFVEQTEGQSDHVLRVIISDKGVSCGEFKIDTGILSSDQIEALAKGFLEDRLRKKEKGFSREQIVLTVILTAFATWIATVVKF